MSSDPNGRRRRADRERASARKRPVLQVCFIRDYRINVCTRLGTARRRYRARLTSGAVCGVGGGEGAQDPGAGIRRGRNGGTQRTETRRRRCNVSQRAGPPDGKAITAIQSVFVRGTRLSTVVPIAVARHRCVPLRVASPWPRRRRRPYRTVVPRYDRTVAARASLRPSLNTHLRETRVFTHLVDRG